MKTGKPKAIEMREGEWDDNGCPVSLMIRVTPQGTFGRPAGTGGGWHWCAGITGKPGAFGSGRAENPKAGLRKARQALATALEAMGRLMERVSAREETSEVARAKEMLAEDPARAALARLLAAVKAGLYSGNVPEDDMHAYAEANDALAEAERALEEPERDWKAEARDDWSERALEDAR